MFVMLCCVMLVVDLPLAGTNSLCALVEWVVWEVRALVIITDDLGREKTTPNLIKSSHWILSMC